MVTVFYTNSITDNIRCVLLHNELIRFKEPIEANDELNLVDELLIKFTVWELYENWNLESIKLLSEHKLDKHHACTSSLQIASYQLFNAI